MSERGYDFFVSITYFTDNGSYQNFLFFAPTLSSIILDINKKLVTGYSLEYHLKKLNHLILILRQPSRI